MWLKFRYGENIFPTWDPFLMLLSREDQDSIFPTEAFEVRNASDFWVCRKFSSLLLYGKMISPRLMNHLLRVETLLANAVSRSH